MLPALPLASSQPGPLCPVGRLWAGGMLNELPQCFSTEDDARQTRGNVCRHYGCYNRGEQSTDIEWAKARGAAQHPMRPRTIPPQRMIWTPIPMWPKLKPLR